MLRIFRHRVLFTGPAAFPFHTGYIGEPATTALDASFGVSDQNTNGHARNSQEDDQKADDEDFHVFLLVDKGNLTLARLLPGPMNHDAEYFVYFPFGFANESNFKRGVLIQDHIFNHLCTILAVVLRYLLILSILDTRHV